MDSFMPSLRVCRQRAAYAHAELSRYIPYTMRNVPVPEHCAFRVPLLREDEDFFLSISFPPDYEYAETALFRGDEMIYIEDWGYEDVRRGFGTGDPADLSTINALEAEIRRLGMNNPGNPDDEPESDPEDESVSPPVNLNQEAAGELLRQEFEQSISNYEAYRNRDSVNENPENDTSQYSENLQQ